MLQIEVGIECAYHYLVSQLTTLREDLRLVVVAFELTVVDVNVAISAAVAYLLVPVVLRTMEDSEEIDQVTLPAVESLFR